MTAKTTDNASTDFTDRSNSVTFKKSSLSGASGCVEVALLQNGGAMVRDTKNRDGGTLTFNKEEWVAFVGGVKQNEFESAT